MWKAILALVICISGQVANGQDISADEALFRSQLDEQIRAHPKYAEQAREKLEPLFRHMQGRWLAETWGNVRTAWTRMDTMLELTITGLSVKYADLKRDGVELRSAQGRLEVDVVRQRIRMIFPPGAEALTGPPKEDLSPFRLPQFMLAFSFPIHELQSTPEVECYFPQSEDWLSFQPAETFLAKLQAAEQRAKERRSRTEYTEFWRPPVPIRDSNTPFPLSRPDPKEPGDLDRAIGSFITVGSWIVILILGLVILIFGPFKGPPLQSQEGSGPDWHRPPPDEPYSAPRDDQFKGY